MSRITLQPCFVLHSKPFRNTSVIVDAFSRDYGRVVLVARGVRNRKRGEANAVEPFRPMLYSWQGRGEMYTLTASEEAEQAPVLRRLQGEALYCGYYVNELLLSLLARDDPHTDVFSLYESTIASLDDQDSEREISLRKFEIGLLAALGYGLVTDAVASSDEPIQSDVNYDYNADLGPVINNSGVWQGVRVSGATLTAISNHDLSTEQTRREAKNLLRFVIDHHLGGKPLKSREMYLQMVKRLKQ